MDPPTEPARTVIKTRIQILSCGDETWPTDDSRRSRCDCDHGDPSGNWIPGEFRRWQNAKHLRGSVQNRHQRRALSCHVVALVAPGRKRRREKRKRRSHGGRIPSQEFPLKAFTSAGHQRAVASTDLQGNRGGFGSVIHLASETLKCFACCHGNQSLSAPLEALQLL